VGLSEQTSMGSPKTLRCRSDIAVTQASRLR
jgi:hypothetical protein